MAKRWRPPPMNEAGGESETPKVTLDEKVVRKMLQVNPAMRDGRTTFQVKKDMERGQVAPSPGAAVATPVSGGSRSELDDTVGFFIKGKGAELREQLAGLAARRAALEGEEREVREQFRADIAKFLSMLDPKIVAMHGVSALSKHQEILAAIGLTPAQVLDAARTVRR